MIRQQLVEKRPMLGRWGLKTCEEMKTKSRPPYVTAHGHNFSYMAMYLRFYMEDLMDYFEKRAPKSYEKFLGKFDRRYPSPYVDDCWDD